MVALPNGAFNANQYQPSEGSGGAALPDGIYDVAMSKSELKPTKARDGHFLECTLNVLSGQFVGRTVKTRFNVDNRNPEAVSIAMSELTSLSLCVGIPFWQDSQQLHGRPFKVKVEQEERSDRPGSFQNRVTAYFDAWGNSPNPVNAGQSQGFPTQQAPANQYPQTQPGAQPNGMAAPPMQSAPMGQPPQFPNTAPPAAPYGAPAGQAVPPAATYGGQATGQFPAPPMPPQGQQQPPQGQQPGQWPGMPPQGQQPPQMPPQSGNAAVPASNPQGYNYPPAGNPPGDTPPWG